MGFKCFVAGCKSGYDSRRKQNNLTNKRHPTLFKPPRDTRMLRIWRQVIPRADKKLGERDRICELHFDEEDIIRYFENTCYDGKVFKLKREVPKLKVGAIPTNFPNLPEYSKNLKKIVSKLNFPIGDKLTEIEVAIEQVLKKQLINIVETVDSPTTCFEDINSEIDKSITNEVITGIDANINSDNPIRNIYTSAEMTNIYVDDASVCMTNSCLDLITDTHFDHICMTEYNENIYPDDTVIYAEETNINDDFCANNLNIGVDIDTQDRSDTDNTIQAEDIYAEEININEDFCASNLNIREEDIKTEDRSYADDTNIQAEDISVSNISEIDLTTFNDLVTNLECILKPNISWAISAHDKFVICAKWNEDYMPEKKVIIDCDLNIKVYIKDKEVASYEHLELSCISDVSTILHIIDS